MRTIELDIAVIGGGLAGCSTILHLAEDERQLRMGLFIKSPYPTTNSYQAQGGIAASLAFPDSPAVHLHDTLIAGAGMCDVETVKMVTEEAPAAVHQLRQWGVPFDERSGRLILAREGGHSHNRVARVKDRTGRSIMDVLWKRVTSLQEVVIYEGWMVIDLHWEVGGIRGFLATDGNEVFQVITPQVVLATGGMGQIFTHTSNPEEATGDGLAICWRAGFPLLDLPFMQFHPTCTINPSDHKVHLLTEALRGAGAILVDRSGERIMKGVHPDMELAPRDIVARRIFHFLQQGKEVFLDTRPIPREELMEVFGGFRAVCSELGLNPETDLIPVFPAAHYSCGGIITDLYGRVGVKGLYAIGECARTGLHGANRLASNSLLEALVFSHRVAADIRQKADARKNGWNPDLRLRSDRIPQERLHKVREDLGRKMESVAGVIKNDRGMKDLLYWISRQKTDLFGKGITTQREALELRNLLDVSVAYLEQCLKQPQSIGTFFRDAVRA
ncbi:MAG: FAD-dependent oxidoreductase [Bacteroidota bacterium]|nr:FAD-dependent oxidoreductase [Bacteroidota bacterium]MDX5447656.1 FAD-dependent oxidoreductase [Bacteroidota bacterium]